jgi:hypothetical protein
MKLYSYKEELTMKTEQKSELTVKERMDLQRRLLVVQQTVGRWHNVLSYCSDGDIADVVDALEVAAGIKASGRAGK